MMKSVSLSSAFIFHKKVFKLASIVLFLCSTLTAAEAEFPKTYFPLVFDSNEILLPYISSHDLHDNNEKIKRLLLFIHPGNYKPETYFSKAGKLTRKNTEDKESTLLVAPLFLHKDYAANHANHILYWESKPFWASSKAVFRQTEIKISSYEVLDLFMVKLIDTQKFPNLKTVIIAGYSDGAQMVNRYAATGLFEIRYATPKNIKVRFLSLAAGSYLYFDNQRALPGKLDQFAIPEKPAENYNDWKYGLDNLFSYHRKNKMTAKSISRHYAMKHILYLAGSKDTEENIDEKSKNSAANLQGTSRLDKLKIYKNHLVKVFGNDILKRQQFFEIEGIGRSCTGLLTSPAARKFIFSENGEF